MRKIISLRNPLEYALRAMKSLRQIDWFWPTLSVLVCVALLEIEYRQSDWENPAWLFWTIGLLFIAMLVAGTEAYLAGNTASGGKSLWPKRIAHSCAPAHFTLAVIAPLVFLIVTSNSRITPNHFLKMAISYLVSLLLIETLSFYLGCLKARALLFVVVSVCVLLLIGPKVTLFLTPLPGIIEVVSRATGVGRESSLLSVHWFGYALSPLLISLVLQILVAAVIVQALTNSPRKSLALVIEIEILLAIIAVSLLWERLSIVSLCAVLLVPMSGTFIDHVLLSRAYSKRANGF